MNSIIKLVAVLAPGLVAASSVAQAATGSISPYVEGSYSWTKLESSGYSTTPHAGVVRAGVTFDKYWAIEGLGMFGGSQGDLNVQGIPISLKVKSAYGVYVKGQYPVSPHLELFARVGWLHASVEATATSYGVSASSSDSSFSYGAGFQVPFASGWYAQADYMSYYAKNGDSIRGPSIGVGYRFH